MKRLLLLLFIILPALLAVAPKAYTAACPIFSINPSPLKTTDNNVTVTAGPAEPGKQFKISVDIRNGSPLIDCFYDAWSPLQSPTAGKNTVSYTFKKTDRCYDRIFEVDPNKTISLYEEGRSGPRCTNSIRVVDPSIPNPADCRIEITPTANISTDTDLTINGSSLPNNGTFIISLNDSTSKKVIKRVSVQSINYSFSQNIGKLDSLGVYSITVEGLVFETVPKAVSCITPILNVGSPSNPGRVTGGSGSTAAVSPFNLVCTNGKRGVDTAIGCVPIGDSGETISWFLGWFIGISGGIAFLLILFSGFQIMTASGDPQKLQGGREMLTAAVSGLILIIFSVFLLNLIGVQILKIPGF